MKKSIILAVILGLFFSFSVSAQFKSPKKENGLNVQQKMIPFAMGMSLAVLRERYDENYYEALSSVQTQIRNWSAELKPVIDLKDEKNEMLRREVVDKALDSLKAKSSKPDRWQILAGGSFGDIYAEIKQAQDENRVVDSEEIKFSINLIKGLASNPPADIPWNVVDKLNKFGELSEMDNFSTDAKIKILADRVISILSDITKE